MEKQYQRGNIFLADLRPTVHSEQSGVRPVLVISNDKGNASSPTVIVAAITSNLDKPSLPTHVAVKTDCGLHRDSIILLEQLRTLDKRRLGRQVGTLNENVMKEVDGAIAVSIGIGA